MVPGKSRSGKLSETIKGINVTPVKKREVIAKFKKFGNNDRYLVSKRNSVYSSVKNKKKLQTWHTIEAKWRPEEDDKKRHAFILKLHKKGSMNWHFLPNPPFSQKISQCTLYITLRQQYLRKEIKMSPQVNRETLGMEEAVYHQNFGRCQGLEKDCLDQ
ncbi:MAG: hypothetical protein EZS28_020583 [Streblomastix strix]|uniref:Uncharacterized protein n=1 Tax=Streblomastix strix TaxID=222440 RepID=A0A5J4VMP1_9EUKA|nr:MAG: hypothetical protein EZS28_020583 [Streblomastix strix]